MAKQVVTEVTTSASAKWLKLEILHYIDHNGNSRVWESVARTTTRDVGKERLDAVCIIPTLWRQGRAENILLVKQFRPPVNAFTIEFPAGLIDPNETVETTALRELKEETGYHGKVTAVSPISTLCPGITAEAVKFVDVDIDLDAPENANPSQELEPSESIEILNVPLAELRSTLEREAENGAVIFGGVWNFCAGMERARRFF
eukprot:GDKJ01020067.1.p1 GENE.GDKJ01020067.1~~GDKJ01020067.1.p1  ORF type:complete len:212 (-),score=57.09 GDKJ01020067.1:77-685(-)